MDKLKSVLKFNKYLVKKIIFEANPDFNPTDKIPVEVEFTYDQDINYDGNEMAICLGCDIFKEKNKNYPFSLEIELLGFFSFEENLEPEKIDILRVNATAILFPYLRSIVSSITADSGFQTLVLPVVNIHKMFKQDEPKEQ